MSKASYSLGLWWERLALNFLENNEYIVVATRYRIIGGEIDIIAHNNHKISFVEVKYRKQILDYESIISTAKLERIFKTSQHFLSHRKEFSHLEQSFEGIFIQKDGSVEHIILS